MYSKLVIVLSAFLLVSITFEVAAEDLAPKKFKIGMLWPMSGNYAAIGEDNRQGAEIAWEVSGKKDLLDYVYEDSKANPSIAISEFKKLNTVDKVAAIFAMRGPVGMAINPLSESHKVPILGGVGDKNFAVKNKYAFQIWSKSDEEGRFLASTFLAKDYKKLALVTTEDDWTSAVSQGLRDELAARGKTPALDEMVIPAESDFRSIVLKIRTKSPDVIFANLGLSQIGPFLRQLRDQNINVPIYSNFWAAKKDVVESVSTETLEGVRFVEMDTNLPVLRQKLQSKYSSSPSGATLSAYLATLLMIQAASEPNVEFSSEGYYKALLKQTEVRTPDLNFEIKDRCIEFPLVEKVMRAGKAESTKP